MVATQHDRIRDEFSILLRPDVAVHWRQSLVIYGMICAVTLTVGAAFALQGLWPVLPFVGLEVVGLGAGLYVSARPARCCEWVRISGNALEIRRGRRRAELVLNLDRTWTEVVLEPPRHRWYPSRLIVRSSGREIELGEFLRDEERQGLAAALKRRVGPMAACGAD